MIRVFLGGTVNGSTWRETVMPQLEVSYFNPVVENWDDEAYQKEIYERKNCDFCIYVITPKMTGFYSIAEVVDDSNKRPEKTLFCVLEEDDEQTFEAHQKKSLVAVGKMVSLNGGRWFRSLEAMIEFLNSYHQESETAGTHETVSAATS